MTSDTFPRSSSAKNDARYSVISSEQELRKVIATPPKVLEKRIQSSLDDYSLEFIEHAKLAAIATIGGDIPLQLIAVNSDQCLIASNQRFIIRSLTHTAKKESEYTASLYFIAPGIGHALRINGVIHQKDDQQWSFHIRQVYFHCARAAARAQLWKTNNGSLSHNDQPLAEENESVELSSVIAASTYLLLKTQNLNGHTDLSPRGDPACFVVQLSPTQWLIPERPGNKVAVSLRNIIDTGLIECLLLIPGSDQLLRISGQAQVITSETLLASSAINGKAPALGILIDIAHHSLETQPLLTQLEIWNPEHHLDDKDITSFPKALSAHMNGKGMLSKATGGLMRGVVSSVVKRDMKNLY